MIYHEIESTRGTTGSCDGRFRRSDAYAALLSEIALAHAILPIATYFRRSVVTRLSVTLRSTDLRP